jgi:hypothetical protein
MDNKNLVSIKDLIINVGFRSEWPAINIKDYSSVYNLQYPVQLYIDYKPSKFYSSPEFNIDWIEKNVELISNWNQGDARWFNVCDYQIDRCILYGEQLFGPTTVIEQDGRMGGWLVVKNWKKQPDLDQIDIDDEFYQWTEQDLDDWIAFEDFVTMRKIETLRIFISEMYIDCFDLSRQDRLGR